jgi:hypothetical protein
VSVSWRRLALAAIALLIAGWYLIEGIGFVLDDWFFVRNAVLDGAWHTDGSTGGDRPVGSLIRALTFGAFGERPAPVFIILAIGNAVSAICFHELVRRPLGERIAIVSSAAWLILPTRTSLEAWLSTAVAVGAQLMVLAALVLLLPPRLSRRRIVGASVLVLGAILSYESAALLAFIGTPLVRWGAVRRIERQVMVPITSAVGAGLLWAVTHWNPSRDAAGGFANPLQVLPANFGWGIAPDGVLSALPLIGVLLGLVFLVRRIALSRTCEQADAAVGVGLVVLIAGVAPFVFYFYAPLGAGDRLNWISAFGAALMWGGLFELLWSVRRELALAAAAGVVALAMVERADRTELWTVAGRDGWRVSRAIADQFPDPDRSIVVGPEPIQVDNVAAFVDASNVSGAVQLAYRDRIQVELSYTLDQWTQASSDDFIKFDQRPLSELDDLRSG